MKIQRLLRDSNRGYTLIEIMIAVMIIAMLISIAAITFETVKARVRYAKMRADMDGISRAAEIDFTNHEGYWAPEVLPGDMPSFGSTDLTRWPKAPCYGWEYSWDNWSAFAPGHQAVRVTIRDQDGVALYGYCLETFGKACVDVKDFGGTTVEDITTITNPYIYCNEVSGL